MSAKIDFQTEQQVAMLIAYAVGHSFLDIAKAFQCSKTRIRSELISLGVEPDRGRSLSYKMKGKPSSAKGRKWTEESKAKLSASLKGRAPTRTGPHSESTKAKISAATKGKNVRWTAEEKAFVEKVRQASKRFICRCLKASKLSKADKASKILGYTPSDLAKHLGPKPSEDCHIDHYVPIAEFIRRGLFDPMLINSLPNLRWLSAEENRRKSDSVPHDAEHVIEKCMREREVLTAHFNVSGVSYTKGLA